MVLEQIKDTDLIFSGKLEDIYTNTHLVLADYDWMNYILSTHFRTTEYSMNVTFNYFGMVVSTMEVEVTEKSGNKEKIIYEYPTEIFEKYIVRFLQKHIKSWTDEYAFSGEDIVIDFYNEVLEVGFIQNNTHPFCIALDVTEKGFDENALKDNHEKK